MARTKGSAIEALKKLCSEQGRLAAKEAELKAEAAGELGRILIDLGAELFDPGKLRQLVKRSIELGIDPALDRLSAPR